ncbi:MAG: HPr family phosphocarrier protein [Thermoproteus sp.]
MKIGEFTLVNKAGLHARPATIFIKEMRKFKSNVIIEKGDKRANGKNLIEVLSLGADYGDRITIIVEGEDEEEAFKRIHDLINNELPKYDNIG